MNTSQNVLLAMALVLGGLPAVEAAGGSERSSLYGISGVNSICSEAQSVVTTSDLAPGNAISNTWDGFVQSDADPYSVVGDNPPLEYSPPEAPDLPLSSTQHIFYGSTNWGREYPTVVSCKMKNAEYLNARDPGLEAVDQPCKAVNADYLGKIMASLHWFERRRISAPAVLEDDVTYGRGSEWTAQFPDNPYPVIYREFEGGPIHIKSSALTVPAHPTETIETGCNPLPGLRDFSFCQPRKWGVRYCHLPAPAYVRGALIGTIEVPTCGTDTADPRVCP